jgi:hypothetical protein
MVGHMNPRGVYCKTIHPFQLLTNEFIIEKAYSSYSGNPHPLPNLPLEGGGR